MIEYFREQNKYHRPITSDIIDKIVYKRLWSGELIGVGDTLLVAFLYVKDSYDDIKMITLTDKTVNSLSKDYEFLGYSNDIIPILKHKNDKVKRVVDNDE